MKNIKRLLLVVLILVLAVTAFGCADNDKKITVAASPVPHAEILAQVKSDLAEKGYELEVIEFSDYVQPNMVVEAGDVDANFFQHITYLNNFNEEKKTNIVSVAEVHFEPLGVYPGKSNDLSNIPDGATIAVPNDTTNEARALLLLEANGIIKIKDGAGLTATKKDIVDNPYNVDIIELEAAQVARVVAETDFVVLNGNYALEAGLSVGTDALAKEDKESEAAQTYANILCVKKGNEETKKTKALIEVLKSDKVKQYIADTYNGAVVAID